jgi:hypothetical protein
MPRKVCDFHGGDYEECRLVEYKNPIRTSQEIHYVSATETTGYCYVRFRVFTEVTMKNAVFLDMTPCGTVRTASQRASVVSY